MSQQQMPIVSIVSGVAGDEMSDIQFLAIKEFTSKLVSDTGTVTTATNGTQIVKITAPPGKELYIAKANVSFHSNAGGSTVQVDLQSNSVVIDSYTNRGAADQGDDADHDFIISGEKVTSNNFFEIVATTIGGVSTTFVATITGWEENTGASPQEPPLNPV